MADGYTWMIRLSESEVRGPFDRGTMLRMIGHDEIPSTALISRVGDRESQLLKEHEDFSGCFTPGTVEFKVVQEFREKRHSSRTHAIQSRRRQQAVGLGLLAVAVLVPVGIVRLQVGLVPASWVETLTLAVNDATAPAPEPVVELPATPVIRALQARWGATPSSAADLVRARMLLWKGSRQDVDEARNLLEALVAHTPEDVEAIGSLTEAYARLWEGRMDQARVMMELVDRADSLAPGSVAATRARAAAAVASGSWQVAERTSLKCSTAEDQGVDMGCQVLLARTTKDDSLLQRLDPSVRDSGWVRILRADLLLDAARPAEALLVARKLTESMPEDAHGWAVRGRAAAGVGAWDEALTALDRSLLTLPDQVEQLMLRGRIKLMVKNQPGPAQADFEQIMRAPWFDQYGQRVRVWSLASVAHLAENDPEGALILAEKALAADPDEPTALLYAARALSDLKRRPEAEVKLVAIRNLGLHGRMASQLYGWSANILLDLDKKNAAMESLGTARSEAPDWPEIYLEGARLKFAMNNSEGAVADILHLGHLDLASWQVESPLVDVWYPRRDWSDVEKALSDEVRRQLKYGKDNRTVVGILALVTGRTNALTLLERAVEREEIAIEERAVYAHGALAQLYLARGKNEQALKHIDRVLAQDSRRPLFQGLRGRALSRLGNGDGAMKAFDSAFEQSMNVVGPQRWRAEALAKMHRDADAIRQLDEVTSRWPQDLEAQQLLLQLLEARKP